MKRQSQEQMHQLGFSLMEIMMVLAIIAIIMGFALPTYSKIIAQANRKDCVSALLLAQANLEKCFSQNRSYRSNNPSGSVCTIADQISNKTLFSEKQYCAIVWTDDAALSPNDLQQAYTITALTQGAMKDDPCGNFVLTHNGKQSLSNNQEGYDVETCWGN